MGRMFTRSFSVLSWPKSWSITIILVLLCTLLGAGVPSVHAQTANTGYRGPSITGASTGPSGSKPESKLWFNDGFWWGSMWHAASGDYHIFKLDRSTQTWIDTGTPLDPRPNSRADVLWDGSKLYVASHVFTESTGPTTSSNAAKLWRFSYDPALDKYSLDSGFPVDINAARTETLVIDKDSTGQLWATWVQQTTSTSGVYQVYVNRTTGPAGDDRTWGTPFSLAVSPISLAGATVAKDDISSVITFGGNKIGIMWSNQATSAMYFAIHNDVDADTVWQSSRTAIQGPNNADDHINLKSLQADAAGRVFAAVKTSHSTSASPLIMLLVRDQSGNWTSHVHSRVVDNQTRPIVLLDKERNSLYMYTSEESGGSVYEKSSSISSIAFGSGKGTTFIQDAASAELNNVTSTKQNVDCASGIVVLATNDVTDYYWHNYRTLPGCGGTPPPDTTAPTVSLSAPTNGATVSGSAVTVSATAGDNVAVAGVQFKLDGNTLGSEDTTAPYAVTWNTTTSANGPHTLTAVARDAAGNTTTATAVNVTVSNTTSDTIAPTVAMTTPANGATVSGSVSVAATASDNVGVVGVQFKLGGANLGTEDTSAPYSVAWDTTTMANGTYTLTAVARDAAGNSATSAAISVTVSNTSTGGSTFPFSAEADTYVDQANPTASYATGSQLQAVGGSTNAKQSFLRFTVSGLPSGASVATAKLRLVVTNDSTSGGIFNVISNNTWAENINWNTKPPIDGPEVASLGAVGLSQVIEVDVTSAVSGNGTYSFAITLPSNNTNTLGYASRQNSTTANRPQLVVTTR